MNKFNDFLNTIKRRFQQSGAEIQLIYINAGVFLVLKIVSVLLGLMNMSGNFLLSYLAVPADLAMLLRRFWTPVTYMFLHTGFFHILFNMICLYWFGKMFLLFFSGKQLSSLYILGGLAGALLYVISYNIFPYYAPMVGSSLLLGASASVMAIMVAVGVYRPDMKVRLFLFGNVKLKYLAIIMVLVSYFGILSSNAGGELAHLGGALAGFVFAYRFKKGKDITKPLSRLLDRIANLFKPRKLKVKKNPNVKNGRRMTDAEWNSNKARNMEEIDKILDKIKTSGYESLSDKEKKRLFEQSNKKQS